MPSYIDTGTRRHVMTQRLSAMTEYPVGRTLCGRTVKGTATGHSIVTLINCKTCHRLLRNRGWEVGS